MKKGAQSMHEYTMAIKQVCDLLAACGSSISEVEQIATILNGLPNEYEPSIAAITASKDSYSVENIVSILVDAESRMEDTSRFPVGIHFTQSNAQQSVLTSRDGSATLPQFESSSSQANNTQSSRYKGRPRPQCQLCGKLGHLVDRCWHRFDQNFKGVSSHSARQSPKAQDADIQVNALMVDGPFAFSKWFPDSGATHHVASSASTLQEKNVYSGYGKVHLGDGTSLLINHVGSSFIEGTSRTLCLDQVLHVPKITKNLLSVAKFAQDNCVFFEFHADVCYVKDSRTKEVLLKGKLDGGLYSFECQPSKEASILLLPKVCRTTGCGIVDLVTQQEK
ncbi:hypothetical protein V6N12_036331 [Hibiscus sabdariffa]|uniref:Retrovirus-related Pol polyprotein from transposon TNT 1-94-like beta-barrel domain-containing protein n=1 Tax=Hibiscus sabdariffa TaxID=183260 RepID=A0ABR2EQA6_9ROSI